MKEIGLFYGIMYDSLEKQVNAQGFTLGEDKELFEKLRFSVNMCGFHSIATDSQIDMMFKKLNKKVKNSLTKIEEEE